MVPHLRHALMTYVWSSRIRVGSAADEGAQEELEIGGALGHPPHEVRVPGRAVRDVDPDSVAFARQLLLEVATDAVQHLDLELPLSLARLRRRGTGMFDELSVVGPERGVAAMGEQPVRAQLELRVDPFLSRSARSTGSS
jgi:hypothetical protein